MSNSRSFTDEQGRRWIVKITVATLKRVKELTDADLASVVEGELLGRLSADPVLLCDVLYAVCKPQAEREQVTDEQFGEALAGDALGAATEALLGAIVDFFPDRTRRDNLLRVLDKSKQVEAEAQAQIGRRIEALDPKQVLEELLQEHKSGGASTSSPASWGSTPAPTPSGS